MESIYSTEVAPVKANRSFYILIPVAVWRDILGVTREELPEMAFELNALPDRSLNLKLIKNTEENNGTTGN